MFKVVDSAVPVACWSCSAEHPRSALFCPQCGKIQASASEGDFFQVFNLEPGFQVDLPALEVEFHRLSRKLHPDRFARAGEQERAWSLAGSSLLNDAYRTLKDPVFRTEYLLKLEGAEIGEENAGRDRKGQKDPSRVPADLLEEVFELNMQLEEMRMERMSGESDSSLQRDLELARRRFEGLLSAVNDDLRAQWSVWDGGDEAARAAAQKTMVALLDRRRYLSNLVRDVTETLGA
jgi:molecular chaperone HscB